MKTMENVEETPNGGVHDVNKQNDEKAPDSSDNGPPKNKGKGKKRKKPKDSTAPRVPLTGYVRYLNDRREAVRKENPTLNFAEITKMLASEWGTLASDKKQCYLDAAEQDRERYSREVTAYKQTDAYKKFKEQTEKEVILATTEGKDSKDIKEHKEDNLKGTIKPYCPIPIKDAQNSNQDMDFSNNFDIPIFTEEFLDHNKNRDTELRQLRKSNTDYEQQNAILQKHIENMKNAIDKLETDICQQKKNNVSLQEHLDRLRRTLVDGFSPVKLPGVKEMATYATIDSYMTTLHSMLLENSTQDASLLQTIRDIVGRMEFNG